MDIRPLILTKNINSFPVCKVVLSYITIKLWFVMELKVVFILFMSLMIPGSFAATFTFRNNCPYRVWPGILTNPGLPQFPTTGFELAPGATRSENSAGNWGGRFWARTGCNGQFTCETGNCGPSLACRPGAGGAPPVTLAEFTLNGNGGQDFYDISNVDGFNIPVSIRPDRGCRSASCVANINSVCPPELRVVSNGNTVGCKSACLAFNRPEYCCTGEFNNPERCQPTNYSRIFKNACPEAYSYAYDDRSSTFTCSNGANYGIVFCP